MDKKQIEDEITAAFWHGHDAGGSSQRSDRPQRTSGRALYSRRVAPLGHPQPRSDDERSRKLSGRALMVARSQSGGQR